MLPVLDLFSKRVPATPNRIVARPPRLLVPPAETADESACKRTKVRHAEEISGGQVSTSGASPPRKIAA